MVTGSNYEDTQASSFFPLKHLKKDKKFMKILLDIMNDFEGGSKKFI
jgi:hypothetical protein